jgi:hypothetical protein
VEGVGRGAVVGGVGMLLRASSDVSVLFGEDAYDAGGDYVMDDGKMMVLAWNVDSEFLGSLDRANQVTFILSPDGNYTTYLSCGAGTAESRCSSAKSVNPIGILKARPISVVDGC